MANKSCFLKIIIIIVIITTTTNQPTSTCPITVISVSCTKKSHHLKNYSIAVWILQVFFFFSLEKLKSYLTKFVIARISGSFLYGLAYTEQKAKHGCSDFKYFFPTVVFWIIFLQSQKRKKKDKKKKRGNKPE